MKTRLVILFVAALLTACGFHLRGQNVLPFTSVYVQSANEYAPFTQELKRALQANGVQLTEQAEQAQLTLRILSDGTEKQILSLSGGGRVREYQLRYRVSVRVFDAKNQDWLPADEIAIRRDFSYDDAQVLAKEQEETLLYQNMRSDAVQQVLRRLSHAKVQP